jgi:hypothetical protein
MGNGKSMTARHVSRKLANWPKNWSFCHDAMQSASRWHEAKMGENPAHSAGNKQIFRANYLYHAQERLDGIAQWNRSTILTARS